MGNNNNVVSKSGQISKNQFAGHARLYHYNMTQTITIQNRTEPSRALGTCHIHARVATTILKCQETSRTGHNHHAVFKTRKISKNQPTGHGNTYYYNKSKARTIQKPTEPSRDLRSCHIHGIVATSILKWQESSRTSQNHRPASISRKISKN